MIASRVVYPAVILAALGIAFSGAASWAAGKAAGASEAAPAKAGAADERLSALSWMAGSWRGDNWETHYTSPEGGVILSVSKEFIEGGSLFWEFEKIEIRDDSVYLTPYLRGKETVSFELVAVDPDGRRAVFSNTEHDFPSRIVYHRTDDGHLVINVSGVRDGRPASQRMDLKRRPGS